MYSLLVARKCDKTLAGWLALVVALDAHTVMVHGVILEETENVCYNHGCREVGTSYCSGCLLQ